MLRLSKARLALAAGLVAVRAGVGVGIAAWSTNGSGTASAKAATASAITLSDASASTTGDLWPGGSGALKVKVTNPNAFPVQITAVSANGTITSDAGAAYDAGHGVAFSTQTGLSLALAAGATTVFSLAGAVSMSTSSVNSCQGALLSIPRQRHRDQRVAVLLALLIAPAAAGAWSATGGGSGSAAAASMPAESMPAVVAMVTTVTVSWGAASVGGSTVEGYLIRRYDGLSGAAGAIGGTCAGLVAATPCTDSAVPLGTWRYSVTPRHHGWTGVEGARSITVAITL